MKRLFTVAIVAFSMYSCGEAGLGFNIGKEFPLGIPFDIPSGSLPISIPGNPDGKTETESYSLSKVDAFSDDLDNVEDVVIEGLAYEISGVDNGENYALDEITIELKEGGTIIGSITLPGSQLQNVPKTDVTSDFSLDELAQILRNKGTITSDVTFDFGEVPNDDISFNFSFYFDVVVKVRDL